MDIKYSPDGLSFTREYDGKIHVYSREQPNYNSRAYFYQKLDQYQNSLDSILIVLTNIQHTKEYYLKKIPTYNAKLNMIEQRTNYMLGIKKYWLPTAHLQAILEKVKIVRTEIQKTKERVKIE